MTFKLQLLLFFMSVPFCLRVSQPWIIDAALTKFIPSNSIFIQMVVAQQE